MKILRLQREEIDKSKWNSCVHYANNGNVCGYMWYLDAITKDWEGLVEEGYGTVFPLIWKRNWLGQKKIYQPELILEGGIYSENILSPTRIKNFIQAIPDTYKSFKIHFSNLAKIPDNLNLNKKLIPKEELIMNKPYEELRRSFSPEFVKQLERAEEAKLQPVSNLKPEKVVAFYKANSGNYRKEHYYAYLRIMYNAMHRGWGFANGISNESGSLLAVVFFIYSHGKIMTLLPVVSSEGLRKGALELVYSMILQTHANKPVVLDFNGYADLGIGSKTEKIYQISR